MSAGYTSSFKQIDFDDYTYSILVSDTGSDSRRTSLDNHLRRLHSYREYFIRSSSSDVQGYNVAAWFNVSGTHFTQMFGVVLWT